MTNTTPDYKELYQQQNKFMFQMARFLKLSLLGTLKNGYSFLYNTDCQMPEPEKERITQIFESLHPTLDRVNEFQEWAEILLGRKILVFSQLKLNRPVNAILAGCKPLLAAHPNIAFETEIPSDLPVVKLDLHRFPQIALNLFDNACKFSGAGTVCLRITLAEHEVLFQMQDNGIGIPAEKFPLVFEPFQTILEDPDDPRVGFGLGLPIARYLVESHGGRIWFESEYGKGTSFFFTLPTLADDET